MRSPARHERYTALCKGFARTFNIVRARQHKKGHTRRGMESDIILSGIDLDIQTVSAAANGIALAISAAFGAASIVALLAGSGILFEALAVASLCLAVALRELVLGYPSGAAKRRAAQVLKDSTRATNLMIMSLGHEPSISKAIVFASRDDNSFSEELRGCVWSVVMGRFESFEEALHALGSRWVRFSGELKATLNSMVTASCEATEEGRRRALDRANNAMIVGAKRRIEEYALSLSAPSMVMFGLGILLPLIVGSFLPMLSWDLWSLDRIEDGVVSDSGGAAVLQTVFLMNILFPALAFLVASNAVSRHPLETKGQGNSLGTRPIALFIAALATCGGVAAAWTFLDGFARSAATLLCSTVPMSTLAVLAGWSGGARRPRDASGIEDALFVTGARMIEGENFEAALDRASLDLDTDSRNIVRSLSFRSNIVGQDLGSAIEVEAKLRGRSNALEAFKVVQEAAAKDEGNAGLLAMDLAAYLKDLHDLEDTLKGRLRPTISMMRMTAYALGPVVLGVTYAIFLSMSSMMGAGGGLDPGLFVLVLGVFLAEAGAIVSYFVWGIEGKGARSDLMLSVGTCVMLSESIFLATSFMASR